VEVERYRFDVRARLHIVEHLRDAVAVEPVHRPLWRICNLARSKYPRSNI
jgi:hypothetical protein